VQGTSLAVNHGKKEKERTPKKGTKLVCLRRFKRPKEGGEVTRSARGEHSRS